MLPRTRVVAPLALLALGVSLALPLGTDGPVVPLLVALAALGVGAFAPPPVVAVAGSLAALGLTAAGAARGDSQYTVANDLAWYAFVQVGMPALVGRLVTLRRRRAEALRRRADELAAERDRRAAIAALDERLRLAGELDGALTARLTELSGLAASADRASELGRVEQLARAALDDVRTALGWLRSSEPAGGEPAPVEWRRGADPADNGAAAVAAEPPSAAHDAGPTLSDAAIAVGLGVALGAEVLASDGRSGGVAVNVLLVACCAAPIAWRRRAPLIVAACVLVAMALTDAVATDLNPLLTPIALAGLVPYAVGAHRPRRPALGGLVLCLAGALAPLLLVPRRGAAEGAIAGTAVVVALAWVAGRWVRAHDHRVQAAGAEVARREAERRGAAGLAIARERARIARDLHDAVAHALTASVLQAQAAQRVADRDPEAARTALDAVAALASEGLGHLHGTSGSPGRDGLPALVAAARGNGLRVTLEDEAPIAEPVVEEAVYRTVQEALTNVARHAAGATVAVRLRQAAGALLVEVLDDGGAEGALVGTGTGLRGMRERVEACGGHLESGPRADGGFGVRAELPA